MGVYDTIVLLLVLAGAFMGWRKGLASQIASIISLVASYFVAVNFRDQVAAKIDAAPPWNTFAAMLILFVGTSLIIWVLAWQVRSSIEAMKLKDFDYQLGAIFGGFKGFIVASLVTLFAITLLQEDQRQVILHSRSGAIIARFLHGADPIMPDEVRNFLGPYLQRLDQELENSNGGYQAGTGTGFRWPWLTPSPTSDAPGGTTNPWGGNSYGQPSATPGYPPTSNPPSGYSQQPQYRPVTPPAPLSPGTTPWNSGSSNDEWRATSPPPGSRF